MRASWCVRTSCGTRRLYPRPRAVASLHALRLTVHEYSGLDLARRPRSTHGGHVHPLVALSLGLSVTLAATTSRPGSAALPATPGTPGYRLPWNRPTLDTVVDLAPGERVNRFEFHGRLIGADDRPLAGTLV